MFKEHFSGRVSAAIVWVPVLPPDSQDAAEGQATILHDDRVTHLWDGACQVSGLFARGLSLTGPGWDLYLLYEQGVRWTREAPAAPTFWMHQLSAQVGADLALHLHQNPHRLGEALDRMLGN